MSSALRFTLLTISVLASTSAWAYGGGGGGGGGMGGWGLGINLGVVNSSQDQMNDMISTANSSANGPITTRQMNQAYEAAPFLTYRYSGTMYAVQLRPSFFYQSQSGHGTDGGYDFSVTGWTVFPMLRLYPLENEFMKFYMQFGLGYGQMNGKISEGPNSVSFSSGAFGTTVGMGAEFCFSAGVHCINFEGDYRYLSFQRSIVDSSAGSITNMQTGKGQELELDNSDVAVRMGGLMFFIGYTMWL